MLHVRAGVAVVVVAQMDKRPIHVHQACATRHSLTHNNILHVTLQVLSQRLVG
jgi:hypothetical protein